MRIGIAGSVILALLLACGGGSSSPSGGGGGGTNGGGDAGGGGGGGATTPCTDTQNDPNHCGACDQVCAPVNAVAVCTQGVCGRGNCSPGFYDIDGDASNGCEASCHGATCQVGDRQIVLSAPPIPETGLVASGFSSGGPVKPDDEGVVQVLVTDIFGGATPLVYHDPKLPEESFISSSNALVQNWVGYGANFF